MNMVKKTDFKIIDVQFVAHEEDSGELLKGAKEYADSEIGLYCLEAKARKLSDGEMLKYQLEEHYSLIELSIIVWEGYANDDMEEVKKWIQKQTKTMEISFIELKARDMQDDEFEAFQVCAPEYFEDEQ